jgi:MFS family permease
MMPLVTMIAVTNLLDAAVFAVLVPVWVRDHGYGPGHIGLIFTSFAVTATAFALVAAAVGDKIPRKLVFTLAFLVCGAPRFLLLAFDAPLWAVMAVHAVAGIGAGFINPVLGALFIERIPRQMLGRVNSLADAICWTGVPLGGVIAGVAIAGIALAPALLAAGGIYFVATMAPVLIGRTENWGGRGTKQDQTDPRGTAESPDPAAVPTTPAS